MVESEVRPALVGTETRGAIRVISLQNPPVNALSFATAEVLLAAIEAADRDEAIKAIVLSGSGGNFSGGADINDFLKPPPPQAKNLRHVVAAIEKSGKTFVAAIAGNALGGGLELALACDYRIATPASRVGLPEIKLGLIPGAGGTQRLPRLLGPQIALDFMLKGELKTAQQAKTMGVVDEIHDGDVVARAVELAEQKAGSKARASAKTFQLLPFMTAMAHGMVPAEAKGGIAAHKLIDAIEAASQMEFGLGIAHEARLFEELAQGTQAQAAIHLFFAERELGKIPGVGADVKPKEIRSAAIVGAGTMGTGIAMVFVNAGIPVHVIDVSAEQIERGKKHIADTYEAQVKKGRMTAEQAAASVAAVEFARDYAGIAGADLVVEAVFESMKVKKEVFAALEAAMKPEAILASNTSTLDIDEIAAVTTRADKVLGLHFFAPANVMQLLEVVRGKSTSAQTLATAMALAKKLRKKGVLSGNAFGFIGNRMLFDYIREANFLVEEGASPQQVDNAIKHFGFPMGPFAMADLSGLDVFYKISLEAPPVPYRTSEVTTRLYELGRYGQKTGKGFFRYEPGKRDAQPDPEVDAVLAAESKRLGITRREITHEEILSRCMYALVNQGAQLLGDGIALRPGDEDIAWIYGYGFPGWHGGPMWWADTIGVKAIYDTILSYQARFGNQWQPAPLLKEVAEKGGTFAHRPKLEVNN
ncbi:MAG: 3-hydroxyacyl-CoA dehydrogenase NAD-binding domain-containing protein [Vulcanimicrobiaceae bacterium]